MSLTPSLPTTAPDTDDEAAVRETAREIAARCAADNDHAGCWKRIEDAGFFELRSPDESGRPMADTTMTTLVVQELAAAVCGAPLVGMLLASELVRLAGGAQLEVPTTVLLAPDLSRLSGRADQGLAWDAGEPVVQALTVVGDELVSVELADATVTQDLSRTTARPSGTSTSLGLHLPAPSVATFESFARLLLTADVLGAAGSLLADAVRYAGDRIQFGKPIGTFQAVQHVAARAYVDVEGIRSALLYGTWALDEGRDHVASSVVAKAYAGRAGVSIVEAAIQVYGGVAITWEFPAHRHLRRVLLDSVVMGGPDALSELVLQFAEAHGGEVA